MSSKAYINATYNQVSNTITFYYRQNNKKQKEYITNFYPYFYIKKTNLLELKDFLQYQNIKNIEEQKEYVKIIFKTVPDLVRCRDLLIQRGYWTGEADIPFVRRYMIDTLFKINPDNIEYAKLFIDIETDDTIQNIQIGRDKIISIGTYSSLTQKYEFLYGDEKQILLKLCKLLEQHDIIVAYNGEQFDYPYIKARLAHNKLSFDFKQVQLIDIYRLLYYSQQQKMKSYTLNNVGKELLKLEKIERTKKILDLAREELEKYNLRDVEIIVKLEEKYGLIKLKEVISNFCGAWIEDISPTQTKTGNTVVVETTVMRKIKELGKNIVYKTKTYDDKPKIEFVAGMVFDPVPGIHENVYVIDYLSLYNRIVQSANISPETYDENGTIKIPISPDDKHNFKNTYSFNKKEGIIPITMKELEQLRNYYKKERDKNSPESEEYQKNDLLQATTKTILLSFWGVMGSKNSRLYKKELPESVTSMARYLIKTTKENLEVRGWKVIGGDTDSLFISKKDSTSEDVKKLVYDLNLFYHDVLLNEYNQENACIEIKYEKLYKKIIFVGWEEKGILHKSKKRYVGNLVWKEGKTLDVINYVGLESIRSDNCIMAQKLQQQVCEIILRENNKEKIIKLLLKIKEELKNKKVNKEELVLNQRLTKTIKEYEGLTKSGGHKGTPLHVRAAKEMELKGLNVSVGTKIPYLVTNFLQKRVAHPSLTNDYDNNFYWQNKIYPPTMRVLKSAYPETNWEQYIIMENSNNLNKFLQNLYK
jgi:DNA polymerase elongation subunit (family B)